MYDSRNALPFVFNSLAICKVTTNKNQFLEEYRKLVAYDFIRDHQYDNDTESMVTYCLINTKEKAKDLEFFGFSEAAQLIKDIDAVYEKANEFIEDMSKDELDAFYDSVESFLEAVRNDYEDDLGDAGWG